MAFGGGLAASVTTNAATAETNLADKTSGITGADGEVNIQGMLEAQKAVLDYGISVTAATNLIKGEGDPFKDTARNLGG